MKIGIISGHNIEGIVDNMDMVNVDTEYGNVSLSIGDIYGKEIVFLNRHGLSSDLPPHKISYRANIEALKLSGVDTIISFGTVGSLNKVINPGSIVIPHDFIDFTKNRTYTFFDDSRVHIDMSEPFCPYIRDIIKESCKNLGVKFFDRGVYLATEGPRLETKSEISLFSKYADIVGMTLVPELILAREKEMCYGAFCLVCNMATGFQGRLSADEIKVFFNKKKMVIRDVILGSIRLLKDDRDCGCRDALKGAKI